MSAEVAWASGTAGTWVRTTDGGANWRVATIPGAGSLDLRDVHAVDDKTAYALSIGGGELSRVFKTSDGGVSWETSYVNRDSKGFLDAIAFWDREHGLALGDPVDGRFVVLTTDNGGKRWEAIVAEKMPAALPGEGAFAASGTCLVVDASGRAWFGTGGAKTARVFRSNDRGRSWEAFDTPIRAGIPSAGIFSLAVQDAERIVAIGGDYKEPERAGSTLALSADGGRTWRAPSGRAPAGYRSAVAVVPGTQGQTLVTVGVAGSDISTDGGQNWRALSATGFHAVGFASNTAGWAVGENGAIAKFTPAELEKR